MYGKEPDCSVCMQIELSDENYLPFSIYQEVKNQLILAGMDGAPIDISIPAVKIVMDFYGVGDNQRVFRKVLMAARAEIHEIHETRKRERQTKGN